MHANMYVVCTDVCEHACSGEEDPSDMAPITDTGISCLYSYEFLKISKMHISDLVIRKNSKKTNTFSVTIHDPLSFFPYIFTHE